MVSVKVEKLISFSSYWLFSVLLVLKQINALLGLVAMALACGVADAATTTKSICKGYDGKAFGLCNAYCLAQKCHEKDLFTSGKSCAQLKRKFEQATGEDALPCEVPPVPCPCWTQDYLDELAEYLEDYDLQMTFVDHITEDSKTSSVGHGSSFYQIQTVTYPTYPTGYKCEDQVNSLYVDVDKEEYAACMSDIFDIVDRFEPDLCQIQSNAAETCPCWVEGLSTVGVKLSTFGVTDPSVSEKQMAVMTLENSVIVNAIARRDGSFYCYYGGISNDSMTKEQFTKCYNDLLEKSYIDGDNECSTKAFSWAGTTVTKRIT